MDLFTRCPQCETVFRVTTRHLQASGGQVRCGRCQSVFDAFATLTAKPPGESQSQPTRQRGPGPQTQPPSEAISEVQPVEASGPPDTELPGPSGEGTEPETTPTETSQAASENDPAAALYEWEFKPAPRVRHAGLWLSLSLLLFIGALGQAGYIFRTELMVHFPQLRPAYELACKQLSCEIGLPRLTDQLNIDASDLQFVDPRRPNLVQLTALVRNRARVPVEYPAFELTLTNAQQQVVARRVFLPADYLQDASQTEGGLGGRQELAVKLFLDTGPLRAAGYRIYLFYPSQN